MIRFLYIIVVATATIFALSSFSVDEMDLSVVFRDNFDEGIDQWSFDGGPEVAMTWDEEEGSPEAGSLSLSVVQPETRFVGYLALGPCMSASPGETWRITSMIRTTREQGGGCSVFVKQYDTPDCTGEGSGTGFGGGPPPEPEGWRLEGRNYGIYSDNGSARGAFLISGPSAGYQMTCHFDSVVLSNNRAPSPTEVPTLTSLGLAVLASFLTLAAFVLRRRESR